jgi:hypothetical protein
MKTRIVNSINQRTINVPPLTFSLLYSSLIKEHPRHFHPHAPTNILTLNVETDEQGVLQIDD